MRCLLVLTCSVQLCRIMARNDRDEVRLSGSCGCGKGRGLLSTGRSERHVRYWGNGLRDARRERRGHVWRHIGRLELGLCVALLGGRGQVSVVGVLLHRIYGLHICRGYLRHGLQGRRLSGRLLLGSSRRGWVEWGRGRHGACKLAVCC